MKFFRQALAAGLFAAVLSFGASEASAQCGSYGINNCHFGNLNAFGASGTLYGSGYLPVPPYFAIHPPVYYSHAYYRPYGWTPFAQSAWQGPAVLRPEPRLVINPYVEEGDEAAPRLDVNTAQAEMITNPYFAKQQPTGQGRLANHADR